MSIRPKWSVKYLVGFGAMTINEEEEFYYAWTKFGAWLEFMKHHKGNPPTTYQTNYSFGLMKKDIDRVEK